MFKKNYYQAIVSITNEVDAAKLYLSKANIQA
jgi:hypothetical protein